MAAQMKRFCPGVMLTFPLLQKLSSHSESIKLSPLDTEKIIYCYTDAAVTCGMAYLLLQKKVETDDDKDPEHG